ncbi:hypothetical protein ES708_22664 [subsurface metagenome]
MPRGQADFGAYAVKEVSASISDMGEVAARLGSIDIYDKRGDVVHFDNFEEPVIAWNTHLTDADCYVRHDSTNPKSGSQSIRLHTSNVNEAKARIQRHFPVLASKRLGCEISFSKLSDNCVFHFSVDYFDSVDFHYAEIKFNSTTEKIYVQIQGELWQEVADIRVPFAVDYHFQTVKLVADFGTDFYQRLLYGLNQYDISDIPLGVYADNHHLYIQIMFWIVNKAASGGDIWLDDFIFTQAEP